ncbi:MAG: DegT/DnrJ/EryC1/StrS family aminotransferase [Candidatus Hydrogenedentota bacterium]
MTDSKPPLIPLARPIVERGDFAGTERIADSGYLISGPIVAEFEAKFREMHEAKHAIAVATGSAALWVAQSALGVGPGDEVLVPDMTFVTTASSAMLLGARPVFVDIDPETYTIDSARLEEKITPRTKGIIPVHYAAQTANMIPILEIAKKHGLFVLEDGAAAHLSRHESGVMNGTIGDAGIFSFTPSKPMTTGEGGMITTNSDDVAGKARLYRNIGDVGKFEWDLLGWNFRMPESIALLGLKQIERLKDAIRTRREMAARFSGAFRAEESLVVPSIRPGADHNFQLYTIRLKPEQLSISRDHFMSHLQDLGVSSRLYYPCLHGQKVFHRFPRQPDSEFPVSTLYAETALSLPLYPSLTPSEEDRIIDAVLSTARKYRR